MNISAGFALIRILFRERLSKVRGETRISLKRTFCTMKRWFAVSTKKFASRFLNRAGDVVDWYKYRSKQSSHTKTEEYNHHRFNEPNECIHGVIYLTTIER
jgi:hypothetical protein